MKTLALMVGMMVAACGAPQADTVAIAPLPEPSSQGSVTITVPGSPFTCRNALPGAPFTPLPDREPTTAGMMTEEAARAKRLFDSEKWGEATSALSRVASGETGDDQGNRELAQYHLAIALFRLKRMREATSIFAEIARDHGHLKHNETLLWIYKLVADFPELVRSLSAYTGVEVSRFNNANQRDLYWGLSYLVGRERYERGARDEAAALFSHVGDDSQYKDAARDCLSRLH